MASYTRTPSSVTAEHVLSDTYRNNYGDEIRVHQFRCKVCGAEYLQGSKVYECCPFCGCTIYHYDRNGDC